MANHASTCVRRLLAPPRRCAHTDRYNDVDHHRRRCWLRFCGELLAARGPCTPATGRSTDANRIGRDGRQSTSVGNGCRGRRSCRYNLWCAPRSRTRCVRTLWMERRLVAAAIAKASTLRIERAPLISCAPLTTSRSSRAREFYGRRFHEATRRGLPGHRFCVDDARTRLCSRVQCVAHGCSSALARPRLVTCSHRTFSARL